MKLLVALVDPMVSYRDSSEGLVDLLGGEAFLLEERPPVDDGGALDLGVGEELDGVLDVVLPHGLRRRLEHELLCPGSRVSIRCSCYGRDPVQSAVIRNSGSQSLVGLGIQYNRTVRGGRIMELEGGRYLGLGIAAGRSRWWRPWPRPRLSRDRAGVVGNGTERDGTGEASSFPCAVVLQCATAYFGRQTPKRKRVLPRHAGVGGRKHFFSQHYLPVHNNFFTREKYSIF